MKRKVNALDSRVWMAVAAIAAFAAVLILMHMAGSMVFMKGGWSGFKQNMTEFFMNGLGGADGGLGGIGVVCAVIGVVTAIISFVVHKFNPQSRMPGWITCLFIGLLGAIAMLGMGKPLALLEKARNLIMGWFGV